MLVASPRPTCACHSFILWLVGNDNAAEPEVGGGLHLHLDRGRVALRGGGDRFLLAPRGWLVDETRDDGPAGH